MRRSSVVMLAAPALVVALAACNDRPHSNPKGTPSGEVEDTDDPGDPGTVDDTAPLLTIDRPAFYSDTDTVLVTGTVTDDGALLGVDVAGVAATIETDDTWSALVPIPEAQWAVVEATATDVSGNTRSLQAQIAAATEGTSPLLAGAETVVGPAGRDTLAAWIAPFVEAASFGPPAEILVQDTCRYCPVTIECSEPDVTETISTTGDWTLRFGATLDTASGRLDVDLTGVEVDWDLAITQDNTSSVNNAFGGMLTSTLTGAAPAASCTGLGLDTAFDASAHSWAFAHDQRLYCFEQSDLEAPADALWTPVVPPALSGAVCDWAAWLEPALTTTVPGATLTYAATANADGLHLDWAAAPDAPPDWQALDPGSPVTADGIDVTLLDPLLGAVLHQAVSASLPITAEDSGVTVELSRVAPDSSSLAHVDIAGGTVLVAPLAYSLTTDDGCTESGHLVPAPVDVSPLEDTGTWTMSLAAIALGGSDVADGCDLAETRGTALEAALLEAVGAVTVSWTPNGGLKDEGATLSWNSGAGAYVVTLTDATPPDE